MARESVHKPRPTSELASPQLSSKKTFGKTSFSSSSCETDDSDKTIQPNRIQQEQEIRLSFTSVNSSNHQSHTLSPLRPSSENFDGSKSKETFSLDSSLVKQDARLSNGQRSQDDILLLLLESHNNQDLSVFHQPKTEMQEKLDWQKATTKTNKSSSQERSRQGSNSIVRSNTITVIESEPSKSVPPIKRRYTQVIQTILQPFRQKDRLSISADPRQIEVQTSGQHQQQHSEQSAESSFALPSPHPQNDEKQEIEKQDSIDEQFQRINSSIGSSQKTKSIVRNQIESDKMQRFRKSTEKGKNRKNSFDGAAAGSDGSSFKGLGGIAFPSNNSSSSLFSLSGLTGKKDKGKGRALSNLDAGSSIYGIPTSGSTSSLKLQRPRSWVNSLISAGNSNNNLSRYALGPNSNRAGGTSSAHVRANSIDFPHGTPPVSSLVLQNEFDDGQENSQTLWPLDQGNSTLSSGIKRDASNAAALGRSATRTTVGTLHLATMSTPNLPASSSDEWAERLAAPLLVRNLDDAPRGSVTPIVTDAESSVAGSESTMSKERRARKMTNPWATLNDQRLQEIGNSRLIDAEEEEKMLDDAVEHDRMEGRMASEEQAVLDMLDKMNDTVDTFEKPNVTRAKSMVGPKATFEAASASPPRQTLKRATTASTSALMPGKDAKRRPFTAPSTELGFGSEKSRKTTSTSSDNQKPSVRDFASMFETGLGASDVLLSRAKTQFGRKQPSEPAPLKIDSPSLGSVKKAIQEREGLDKGAAKQMSIAKTAPILDPVSWSAGTGSLLQSMASTLRKKASFPGYRSEELVTESGTDAIKEDKEENSDKDQSIASPSKHLAAPSTNSSIFLSRQDTRTSYIGKHDLRSPNQESYISSDGGTASAFWSRRGSIPDSPSSLPTSPGFQSESDVSSPFGYGFGKRRFAAITSSEDDKQNTKRPVPPLLRRLRTDATQATSIGSMMESDSVKSRILTETMTEEPKMIDEDNKSEISSSIISSILTEDEGDETIQPNEPLKREKSVAFSTLTRSSTRATKKSNTSTIPPTPPRKDVDLPFVIDDSTLKPRSPLRKPILDAPEAGVSPSLLGTPKRAKDLIQFFEQTSAPNSPSLSRTSTSKPIAKQLSPMKGESPAQMASRFRQALGSSGLSNRITIEGTNENVVVGDDIDSAIQEKITTVGRGNRRRARAGGLVGITVGGGGSGGQDPFSSSYDSNVPNAENNEVEEESDEDEENHLPSVLTGQPRLPGSGDGGGKKKEKRISSNIFGRFLSGSSPENKNGKKTEEAQDAPGRTSEGGGSGGGSGESYRGTGKGSNSSPFRSGVKNIIKALSQGVDITGADTQNSRGGRSGGGGGDEQQGGRRTSWQGAHQTGVPPPSSFRDPSQLINMRRQSSSELTDLQSVLSTRTIGTTASFRQKTETGQNLRVDTAATLALMGEPNVEPFRTGLVYYFNVHVEKPIWQRAQAVLLPSALALSWIPTGGGRVSVILDLSACREVHSVPGPDHPSSGDDAGAFVAREQGLRRINPFQLIFNDGVERLAVDTARERVMWVASVWDSLGVRSSSNQQSRSRQVSANYSAVEGVTEIATDIADVHMTTPRPSGLPMSPPPPNFNIQLSDNPVRRLVPSGLAAVPLESSLEDVTQIETSSPDRGRYEAVSAIAAEMVPPPLPPKEKQKRKRFIDEPVKPDSPPNVESSDESKHSQETLVLNEDRAQDPPPNNLSRETFHSSKTHEDGAGDDDFGPRSPISEAVLNFSNLADSDRDIVPADSASQRPSRSLTGTILSKFSAFAGYRSEKVEEEQEQEQEQSPPRTPAQTIRDQFVGGEMDVDSDEPPLTARTLDTVVEETLSQAALTSVQSPQQQTNILGSSRKSIKQKKGGPGSILSVQTSGSVSSQELAKLLQFIEQQNEDRDRRERQMEEQFRAFQETIINLQRGSSSRHSRRSSSEAGGRSISSSTRQTTESERDVRSSRRNDATAAAAATVAADAASIAAMQEKLDRVLSMVGNVTEGQYRLENATEDGTPRGPQPPTFGSPNSAELARIEQTLGSLMNQIQSNTLPHALRADNRSIQMNRPLDGRDRAILADRMVHGTRAANRRMSAPPDMEQDELSEGNDGFLTPMTGERAGLPPSDMADLYSPAVGMIGSTGMIPSHSEGSIVSENDRIPARSWFSADGIPSPPANTEHGASLLNAERRGPVERSAYGMMNSARSQYDPLAPGDSLSNVSIDMEAEIRRRRMRNAVGARNVSSSQPVQQQGGWYTPRPGGHSMMPQDSNSGLGLSMPTPRQTRTSQAIQTPAFESGGEQRAINPDIALLLDAVKDNEDARKAQRQQQQDIARYLNELNSWLEKDVIDRSKEWRTLAMGVTQLHDELNTIRTQAGLATTSAMPGVMAMADGGSVTPVGRSADAGGNLMAMPMPQVHQAPHPDGAGPHISFADNTGGFATQAAHEMGNNAGSGPQGPRGMPTPDIQQPSGGILHPSQAAEAAFGGQMPLTSQALAQLGADAPAPLNIPRPRSPVKRSGTRTWRSQNGPTPLRNDDVWQNSGIVPDKKKEKEEKKAEKRASRRKSLGRIVAGAVGAALAGAAIHEWDKHKDRQRKEGKPEEASKEPDATTGEHVKLDHVPAAEQEKITNAAQSGDEEQIRKVISDASAAGFGKPAIVQMAEDLRKMSAPEGDNAQSDDQTLRNSYDSQATANANRMEIGGKRSGESVHSVGESTLRNAVNNLDTRQGGGDGALALAVEEILKHLLEKKEDEQRIRQAQADAEAMREAERRQEMEERESKLSSLRDQERSELVETIFAKMQAEKDRADAEAAARQREMDPKSAIESLVAAINAQRQSDASQRAAADLAVKQMAEDLVRTTSEANSKLVEAVHTAAKEMLRNNVEAHADDLKRLIGRDVSVMFEDVGKIREAKRALELEMSELFSFKSKHLAEIEQMKLASAASSAMQMAPMAMPAPMPMPSIMPMNMGMGMGMGGMPGMMNFSAAPPMPDIPAATQALPKASAIPPAIPPVGTGPGPGAPRKKDFMSPFSINFGSR